MVVPRFWINHVGNISNLCLQDFTLTEFCTRVWKPLYACKSKILQTYKDFQTRVQNFSWLINHEYEHIKVQHFHYFKFSKFIACKVWLIAAVQSGSHISLQRSSLVCTHFNATLPVVNLTLALTYRSVALLNVSLQTFCRHIWSSMKSS